MTKERIEMLTNVGFDWKPPTGGASLAYQQSSNVNAEKKNANQDAALLYFL